MPLQQATQVGVQAGLEYLQRRGIHKLPGQPVPVFRHPYHEEVSTYLCVEFLPMIQIVAISPYPVPTDCWKKSGFIPLPPALKILININWIPSQSSFLKAEQTQVAQPFLTGEMLQAFYHLHWTLSRRSLSFFVSGSPELDTLLQVRPDQGSAYGNSCIIFYSPYDTAFWKNSCVKEWTGDSYKLKRCFQLKRIKEKSLLSSFILFSFISLEWSGVIFEIKYQNKPSSFKTSLGIPWI